MKTMTKLITGAAAAAMLTVTAAAPAQAQYRRDRVDTGDIITGVAILGGIAAIAAAVGNDGNRYGYGQRYRYRDGYSAAVNACGYQAQRAGGGRISVTDVDRRGNNSFRVRGTIEGAGYGDGRGYERYDRGYDRGYNARGYNRVGFTCTAQANGRVRDFRIAQAW